MPRAAAPCSSRSGVRSWSRERLVGERFVGDGERFVEVAALSECGSQSVPGPEVGGFGAHLGVKSNGFVVVTDEIADVGQRQHDLPAPVRRPRIAVDQLRRAAEVDDRLFVGVQLPRPLAGSNEIVDRLRSAVPEVQVTGEQVEHVVTGSVEALGNFCDAAVKLSSPASEQSRVRDFLDECVVEADCWLLVSPDHVEETALHKSSRARRPGRPRRRGLAARSGTGTMRPITEAVCRNLGGRPRKKIDPRREKAFDGRRHLAVLPPLLQEPVVTLHTREDLVLAQGSNELLHEERIAGRALDDPVDQARRSWAVENVVHQPADPTSSSGSS